MVPFLIAAGAVSVYGKLSQGLFAKDAGKIANQEFNTQADLILGERQKDISMLAEAQSSRRGTMISQSARGGVDVNSGSAFDIQLAQQRFDAIARSRALFEAQLQARSLRFQGAQAKAAGKQAFQQSILSSFGTVANVAAAGMTPATATTVRTVGG